MLPNVLPCYLASVFENGFLLGGRVCQSGSKNVALSCLALETRLALNFPVPHLSCAHFLSARSITGLYYLTFLLLDKIIFALIVWVISCGVVFFKLHFFCAA